MLLPHLASRLYGTPLLLARTKLDIILAVLGSRIGWSEPQAVMALPQARASPQGMPFSGTGIAVIPVHGSLVRRSMAMDAQSGITSYAEIASMLDAAAADPGVNGILLDIDSPGGEAGGVFDLARRVRDINAIKPVWALASEGAYSAAYAIACAASRVYVTQTGGVGSIGVIAMHVDQTARDAQEGYRFTAVTAGDLKNDLSPHEPINKEAMARLQTEVDRLYGLFVDHVAVMRGVDVDAVRDTQAGLFFGPTAVQSGLADAMASPDQVMGDFAAFLSVQRITSAPTGAPTGASTKVLTKVPTRVLTSGTHSQTTQSSSSSNQKEILMNQPDHTPAETPAVGDTNIGDPVQLPKVLPPNPEAPTAPVHGDAGVTTEVVAAASRAARAEAVSIAEICQLAGQSQRTAGFLAEGATSAQVRQTLLAARASSEEITSVIHPDAAKPPTEQGGALMAAVKKLTQKP